MKSNLQAIDPESAILNFFSSFLTDILIITSDIKNHVYKLIGIDSAPFKRNMVQSNIYSIMQACNRNYQDLRRTETLLRGHLRGKDQSARDRDSIRSSRLTAKNTMSSGNINYQFNQIFPYKTFHQSTPEEPVLSKNDKNFTSRPLKPPINNSHTGDIYLPTANSKPKERSWKLNQSKSHGNLRKNAEPSPPIEFASIDSQTFSSKSAVSLINKIRHELGLLGRQQ